jgi:hypothetical protein
MQRSLSSSRLAPAVAGGSAAAAPADVAGNLTAAASPPRTPPPGQPGSHGAIPTGSKRPRFLGLLEPELLPRIGAHLGTTDLSSYCKAAPHDIGKLCIPLMADRITERDKRMADLRAESEKIDLKPEEIVSILRALAPEEDGRTPQWLNGVSGQNALQKSVRRNLETQIVGLAGIAPAVAKEVAQLSLDAFKCCAWTYGIEESNLIEQLKNLRPADEAALGYTYLKYKANTSLGMTFKDVKTALNPTTLETLQQVGLLELPFCLDEKIKVL